MKSRTSFFNLAALRKDISRFAPVWALYLIGGILIGLTNISDYNTQYGYGARDLAQSIGPMVIVNLLYAVVTAELLFGDLFNNRLCNALHAFPLRRESWFATHTAAGLLFSFVPNLIMSICFLPFMGEMWYISALWLLGMTLEYLFFFGLAAFSAMCTGNRFAMAALYALVNFLSMIAYWFVYTFYSPLLYGLHIRQDGFNLFCPTVQIFPLTELVAFQRGQIKTSRYDIHTIFLYDGLSADWWYIVLLAVLGIGLLGAALVLYRRRKLECAGDFAAFSWLKPVFSVVFTLSAGAIFEMLGDTFMGVDYVFLVAGLIVGYFVVQMLLQRTVRVFRKKAFAACAAIGGTLLLSILLTSLDPLGITRWTPKPEKVESIILSDYYHYDFNSGYNRNAQTITNPALIGELVQIHELLLEEGEPDYSPRHGAIHLTYRMTDGRTVERRYYYDLTGTAGQKLKRFFGAPEFILGYTDWEEYLSSVQRVYVEDMEFSGDAAKTLLAAIKADCEAGNMMQNRKHDAYYSWVEIQTGEYHTSVSIYYDCHNTIQWLKDNLTLPAPTSGAGVY